MPEVIPSIYSVETMGQGHHGGLLPSGNIKLRFGEVKREILPDSKESSSKLYREYEVLVQHYESGGATHRMYHNCMVLNSLGGLGDHSDMSLRESDKKDFQLGNGSGVFLLCVEGNDARAVIIGGPQQRFDDSEGQHKEVEFNGVNFQVFADGSWSIVNNGCTNNDGTISDKADKEGAGTEVKVEASGNFSVTTKTCSISIDNKNGVIDIQSTNKFVVNTKEATVNADSVSVKASSVNVDSSDVSVGSNAGQHAVLGEALVEVLSQAFGVIAPTLPTLPQQSALSSASGQLSGVLSGSVKVGS